MTAAVLDAIQLVATVGFVVLVVGLVIVAGLLFIGERR